MQASAFFGNRSSQQPNVAVGQQQGTSASRHEQSTGIPHVTSTRHATAALNPQYQQQHLQTWSGCIRFPASRAYLWDRTVQGTPTYAQPCLSYVEVASSVLHAAMAVMQGQHAHEAQLQLRGQLWVDAAGQQCHMQLVPGRASQPSGADELSVPCTIQRLQAPAHEQPHQPDAAALKACLSGALNARGPAHLGMLFASSCALQLRQDGSAQISGAIFLPGSPLSFSKLAVKRVVDVPLAKQLLAPGAGPTSTMPSDGFLTMDAARCLVPMAASDAQVYSVPLVGVWLHGMSGPQHPAVQAACLRFAYSSTLPDKACQGQGAFLLLLYPSGGCVAPDCYEVCMHDEQGKLALLQFRYRGELLQLRGAAPALGAPQQQVGSTVRLDLQLDETVPQACLLSPMRSQNSGAGNGCAPGSGLRSLSKALPRPGTAPSITSYAGPDTGATAVGSARSVSTGPSYTVTQGAETALHLPVEHTWSHLYTPSDHGRHVTATSEKQASTSGGQVNNAAPTQYAASVQDAAQREERHQHQSSPPPEPRQLAPPLPITPSSQATAARAPMAAAHASSTQQAGPAQNGPSTRQSLDMWLQRQQQQQQQQQQGLQTRNATGTSEQVQAQGLPCPLQQGHQRVNHVPPFMAAGSDRVTYSSAVLTSSMSNGINTAITSGTSNGSLTEVSSAAMVHAAIASVDMLLEPVRSSVASVDIIPEPTRSISPDHMPGRPHTQQASALSFRYPSVVSSLCLKPLYNPLKRASVTESTPSIGSTVPGPRTVTSSYANASSSQQSWQRPPMQPTPYLQRGTAGPQQGSAQYVPTTPYLNQSSVRARQDEWHQYAPQQHSSMVSSQARQPQSPAGHQEWTDVTLTGSVTTNSLQGLPPHQLANPPQHASQQPSIATFQHSRPPQDSYVPAYGTSTQQQPSIAGQRQRRVGVPSDTSHGQAHWSADTTLPPPPPPPGTSADTQALQQQVLLLQQQVQLLQQQLQLLVTHPSTQAGLATDRPAATAQPVPAAPTAQQQGQPLALPQHEPLQQVSIQPQQQFNQQQQLLQQLQEQQPKQDAAGLLPDHAKFQHKGAGAVDSVDVVQHGESSMQGLQRSLLVQQPSSNESSPPTGVSTMKTAGWLTNRSQLCSNGDAQNQGLQGEQGTPGDDGVQPCAAAPTPAATCCPGSTRSAGLSASKRELFGSDCCSSEASSCQGTPHAAARPSRDDRKQQEPAPGATDPTTSDAKQQVEVNYTSQHQGGITNGPLLAASTGLLRSQSPRASSPACSFPQHPLLTQLMKAASESPTHSGTGAQSSSSEGAEARRDAGPAACNGAATDRLEHKQAASCAQQIVPETLASTSPSQMSSEVDSAPGRRGHAYTPSPLYSSSTSALRASASDVVRTRYIPMDDDDDSGSSDSELEDQLMKKYGLR